ncbi:hypothetical protein F5877DRAFT_69951 [Lentinula edodes]|nr:hypothetical protein F5877DRAFT_69951 [Lentinula edodes]
MADFDLDYGSDRSRQIIWSPLIMTLNNGMEKVAGCNQVSSNRVPQHLWEIVSGSLRDRLPFPILRSPLKFSSRSWRCVDLSLLPKIIFDIVKAKGSLLSLKALSYRRTRSLWSECQREPPEIDDAQSSNPLLITDAKPSDIFGTSTDCKAVYPIYNDDDSVQVLGEVEDSISNKKRKKGRKDSKKVKFPTILIKRSLPRDGGQALSTFHGSLTHG